MKVIQFDEYGGPEVLKLIDKDIPQVKKHEVLIKVERIVEKVGSEVENIIEGQRVLASIESGGYAEYATVNERMLVPLPDNVSFEDAVVLPVQGQSAYHILKTMGKLSKGETVLVHS